MKVFSIILAVIGSILLLIALFSGGASLYSLIERSQHGSGLLFADVEFFGFFAIICAFSGALAVFGARKLSKHRKRDES